MKCSKTASDLVELAAGFEPSRTFLTALELGVFTSLGQRERTSTELARALRSDAWATDRLLNALCALGLLRKRRGRFANGPLAAARLVEGRPGFMRGLLHQLEAWGHWSFNLARERATPRGSTPASPARDRARA